VLASLLDDMGVFMGTNRNSSADAMGFVDFLDRWINPVWTPSQPLSPLDVESMRAEFRDSVAAHRAAVPAGVSKWGWKEPRTMYLLPFLREEFPDLRFLHVVRDGRDMAFSTNQNQLRKHGAAVLGKPTHTGSPPILAAELWSRANIAAADFGETRLQKNYLRIRFEDLCRAPDAAADRVAAFAGVQRPTQMQWQVAPPATMGRWQHHASPELLEVISDQAGPGLKKFGYI